MKMPRELIYINPDFIDPAICDHIRNCMDPTSTDLAIKNHLASNNQVHRITDKSQQYVYNTTCSDMLAVHTQMHRASFELDKFYGKTVEKWEVPMVRIYPTGGHFGLHVDAILEEDGKKIAYMDREYTVIMWMNDDYEGGVLRFPELKVEVPPKIGQMVMFPADRRFLHEVTQVTKGLRYQVMTWMAVEGGVRNHDIAKHGAMVSQIWRKQWETERGENAQPL
jgi:predicted 2-oxoglutarate/Fe(II)-dependent dioxygenase YbiX